MNSEQKLKVFEKHLKMIKSNVIRSFTEFCLFEIPEYFWTLAASTSGRRHGGPSETLIDHIQGCLFMGEKVCEQFDGHWKQRQKDQLLSSLILHDGWRCGEPGNERRITQEMIDKRGYSQDKLNNLCTSSDHPEVGYRQVLRLSVEFNRLAVENKTKVLPARDLAVILKAVRYHYGKWMDVPNKPFSLDWPYSSVVVQCHNVDYHQAQNASWWACRRKSHE